MFNSKYRIYLVCVITVVLLSVTCNAAIAGDYAFPSHEELKDGVAVGDDAFPSYKELRGGVTMSYSTEGVFTIQGHGSSGIYLGYFFDTTPGEVRDRDTSNYGRTQLDGTERDLYGIDIGYTKRVLEWLRLGVEASIGYEIEYSKYSDRRFTEDYYLVEESSDVVFGAGVSAGIPITKGFELIGGYNSLKGVVLGIGGVW